MCPKVSVIIPCHNYAHYLKNCVHSVRSQTYDNLEIIVVDDGSTDNTISICSQLNVIFVSKPNGGLASARNYGIRVSTGDYIMCVDADDILPQDSIKHHVGLMAPKTVAQCALQEFQDNHRLHVPLGANLYILLKNNTVYSNAMFTRKDYLDAGGYDESDILRLGYEDWEFWIRLAASGCAFKKSDNLGLYYRVHDRSMIRTKTLINHKILCNYITSKHKSLYEMFDNILY